MSSRHVSRTQLRLADLLAALSVETDLAMGHPPEEAMRTCLVATALARGLGLSETDVADAYWTALLMHIGCTATAHEQAVLFGNEIAVNEIGSKTDFGDPKEMLAFMLELSSGLGPLQRAGIFARGLVRGERTGRALNTAICEVAAVTAERLGFSEVVQRALGHIFERWDGKGHPHGLEGDAILLPARLAQVAAQAVVYDRLGGAETALEVVRRRAGSALDPELAQSFERCAAEVLSDAQAGDPWTKVLDAEPAPNRCCPETGIDEAARAIADLVDLKSTYTLGHSTRVARLAEEAGREVGLAPDDLVCLRRAGYLHDVGRVGIPNAVWEKKEPLTSAEWEQIRLHPYHSERIVARSVVLAPVAPLVGMHHERLDGSGYHRQATASSIPMPARVLAAADAYAGWTEDRAHRPALSAWEAEERMASEAAEGRLDADAVEAVLSAAGHDLSEPVRQGWPADLTDREVDVLRLVARGMSNREAARRLFISPKTVGRHVEHIYEKLEVSSRAAAALFAERHDLLRGSRDDPARTAGILRGESAQKMG